MLDESPMVCGKLLGWMPRSIVNLKVILKVTKSTGVKRSKFIVLMI